MKKYLVAIESDKTKEEIAEKLGVNVESIYTHEELQKAYILNPSQYAFFLIFHIVFPISSPQLIK